MNIILTHEQADFDAIASLLGAYLLNNTSIPVLPRRINRNVRAFLNLYGGELPFIEPRDLPDETVEVITLVDTQSMVSVKGANANTKVHVIDHHPLRVDLPSEWMLTVANTGANTTIFIETTREKEFSLSTIQASLLLLGIYEDTGSLTYMTTTARDLQAASYLLEQGANLSIVADYLNHPLSTDQQNVYDQLRENVDYLKIQGHRVVVSYADASEMDEELSTVAHKFRDLLDPDGLFVLVRIRSGVQLIARSTSDDIDVGKIAVHFGGGGHERAAAGLIKNRDIHEIKKELVVLLPEFISPSIIVSQIMSRDPHLLAPDTLAQEASENMQRYGYEGYPVVTKGKVIGLLTRRAVDRAIMHKLNLTASSLMEAGDFHVHPEDSIESLQRIMSETGWGQIPVLEPESGEILGIVTRTDLLNTLTEKSGVPNRVRIVEKLEKSLPIERLVLLKTIAEVAYKNTYALYIVGGFVRDLLLDRPSLDFDLVVEGEAISLARLLVQKYGGRLTSHARFGTAKWLLNQSTKKELAIKLRRYAPDGRNDLVDLNVLSFPDTVDLVTARTEFYTHPTALPTVERSSIKLDLHRRDFTINTLALRLDGKHYGELYDHWGGLSDLHHGIVKVLHSLSFVDDPTRILRAVRFEQRFNFKIESRTLELMKEASNLLEKVSGDRIRHELDAIFSEPNVIAMLERLDKLRLLQAIHEGLIWDEWLENKICTLVDFAFTPDWGFAAEPKTRIELTYILLLLRQKAIATRGVVSRLKLSAALKNMIHAAQTLYDEMPGLSGRLPSQIVSRLEKTPPKAILATYLAIDQEAGKEFLDKYMQTWRHIEPTINGHQLRQRGVVPGPAYREILATIKNAWLDGEVTDRQEEELLLDQLIGETKNLSG